MFVIVQTGTLSSSTHLVVRIEAHLERVWINVELRDLLGFATR
jgi:hypothetical protein